MSAVEIIYCSFSQNLPKKKEACFVINSTKSYLMNIHSQVEQKKNILSKKLKKFKEILRFYLQTRVPQCFFYWHVFCHRSGGRGCISFTCCPWAVWSSYFLSSFHWFHAWSSPQHQHFDGWPAVASPGDRVHAGGRVHCHCDNNTFLNPTCLTNPVGHQRVGCMMSLSGDLPWKGNKVCRSGIKWGMM